MKNNTTDIYHLVDEVFISGFNSLQSSFMKNFYYNNYKMYCMQRNRTPLPENDFFINMRRHKIKLIQICCPYCGNMNLSIVEGSLSHVKKLNYCTYCGKRSAAENAFFQISRLVRIQHFHLSGLNALKESKKDDELRIMGYDIYQLELIEITSILEVLLRDFFVSFVYLYYKNLRTDYFDSIIHKTTGNDFMNIEKANNHYKKALKINLRTLISTECWDSLLDIVQIRNTLIHNNGMMDKKFKDSKTFSRISDIISGDLIFLDDNNISKYLKDVVEILSAITKLFNNQYQSQLHTFVANYYFNAPPEIITTNKWIPLRKLIAEATK